MDGFGLSVSGGVATLTSAVDRFSPTAVRQAGCYAINHTVAKANTRVNREVAAMSGLPMREVRGDIRRFSASLSHPEASLKAEGPYHRLSEFSAYATSSGVSAAPWGVRRTFPGTFFIARFHNGVFHRQGKRRFPVKQLWGPAIPREMLRDRSVAAWDAVIATDLPARMAHEWGRLMGGR